MRSEPRPIRRRSRSRIPVWRTAVVQTAGARPGRASRAPSARSAAREAMSLARCASSTRGGAGRIERNARKLRERRTEQQPVDDGLLVAALEPAANRAILPLDPLVHARSAPDASGGLQFRRQDVGQRGQRRPGPRRTRRTASGLNGGREARPEDGEQYEESSHAVDDRMAETIGTTMGSLRGPGSTLARPFTLPALGRLPCRS